jgi:hypothetical protein
METPEPVLAPVKNGWHALSREWNLAVYGATEEEARGRFEDAIRKAAELRERPEPASAPLE